MVYVLLNLNKSRGDVDDVLQTFGVPSENIIRLITANVIGQEKKTFETLLPILEQRISKNQPLSTVIHNYFWACLSQTCLPIFCSPAPQVAVIIFTEDSKPIPLSKNYSWTVTQTVAELTTALQSLFNPIGLPPVLLNKNSASSFMTPVPITISALPVIQTPPVPATFPKHFSIVDVGSDYI